MLKKKHKRVSFQQQPSEIGDEASDYQNISINQVSKKLNFTPEMAYQHQNIDFYNKKQGRPVSNYQYRFDNNPSEVEPILKKSG